MLNLTVVFDEKMEDSQKKKKTISLCLFLAEC